MLVLARADVERLLTMPKCIALMQEALASLARGEVVLPLRTVLRVPDSPNVFALMPAYSSALEALGAKLITVFPGNHGTGRDSHQGVVALFDAAHGGIVALMDAASITAIRTAAVSAVATMALSNTAAKTLAILGAGVQGWTHLEAMQHARRFEQVRLWSRTRAHAEALAARARSAGGAEVVVADDAGSAVRGADVVCTVTAAREPVLRGAWLGPGAHVNAVGASIPTARELDTDAVRNARLFVDRRESALNEAGDVLIPMREGAFGEDHIRAELGDVLIGKAPGRATAKEVTLFKSLGIAVEDLACARFLYDEARNTSAGTWVEL